MELGRLQGEALAVQDAHRSLLLACAQSWEELNPESEKSDDYGLGKREGLQEAVEAVIGTLGMQPCEGTEAVPPNARSHTVLLAGIFVGFQQVCVMSSVML